MRVTGGEYSHYVSTGCYVHPDCLTCPLERCIYDGKQGKKKNLISAIKMMADNGIAAHTIANTVGVSIRTVHRYKASNLRSDSHASS